MKYRITERIAGFNYAAGLLASSRVLSDDDLRLAVNTLIENAEIATESYQRGVEDALMHSHPYLSRRLGQY